MLMLLLPWVSGPCPTLNFSRCARLLGLPGRREQTLILPRLFSGRQVPQVFLVRRSSPIHCRDRLPKSWGHRVTHGPTGSAEVQRMVTGVRNGPEFKFMNPHLLGGPGASPPLCHMLPFTRASVQLSIIHHPSIHAFSQCRSQSARRRGRGGMRQRDRVG